jgi:mono/diheme cytochrome c family protein
VALAGCGGGGGDSSAEPSGQTTGQGGTTGGAGEAEGQGDAKLGVLVWHEQGCVNCHELADAGIGATGRAGVVGPNLDEASPSYDLVVERVTNGKGEMPSFSDQMTPADIQNIAAYVSSVAGKSPGG